MKMGMPCSPASSKTMAKGMVVHAVASTTPVRAVSDSVSQKIDRSISPSRCSTKLTTPLLPSSIQRQILPLTTEGESTPASAGPAWDRPPERTVEEDGKGKAEDERQRQRPTGVGARRQTRAAAPDRQWPRDSYRDQRTEPCRPEVANLDIVETEVDGIEDRVEDGGQDEDSRGQHEKVFAKARIAERTARQLPLLTVGWASVRR